MDTQNQLSTVPFEEFLSERAHSLKIRGTLKIFRQVSPTAPVSPLRKSYHNMRCSKNHCPSAPLEEFLSGSSPGYRLDGTVKEILAVSPYCPSVPRKYERHSVSHIFVPLMEKEGEEKKLTNRLPSVLGKSSLGLRRSVRPSSPRPR